LGAFVSGLGFPWGLAFDGNGNLFVSGYANSSETIDEFDPSGLLLRTITGVGLNQTYLAITNVPEPSALVLLLAGSMFLFQRSLLKNYGCYDTGFSSRRNQP
jgi:hypothetical protein